MAATDAEVRAWAREHGVEVSGKGRVGQDARDAYNAAHNGGHEADYPAGMSDADFDATADRLADDLDDLAELPPRPVSPKVGSISTPGKLSARFKRGKTRAAASKTKAKAKPRVSTAELIGSAWRMGAKLAQPIPPMYRTLRLQSVIAGPLLDDAVKGTVADPFLQPLARLTKAGETGAALLAPNLGIGLAMYHQAQCAKDGTEPNPLILQACAEMIRYGLVAMMRVGGDAFAAQLERERDDEVRYGVTADALMEWIMSPPADPAAEEENIARMGAMFAGQPDPDPEPAPA